MTGRSVSSSATSPVRAVQEGDIRVVKVGPTGAWGNNAYIIRDVAQGESLLVDMPVSSPELLDALSSEGTVRQIVATHWHRDHWMSYDEVRAATNAPVMVGDREIRVPEQRIDGRLADGADIRVGSARVTVMHTPGHTPGSICLRLGRVLISGDTLFRGGPGRTFAPGELETLIATIGTRLLPLPDDTVVMPGHGEDTTIGEARRGHAVYARQPKPAGFFGDVVWPP